MSKLKFQTQSIKPSLIFLAIAYAPISLADQALNHFYNWNPEGTYLLALFLVGHAAAYRFVKLQDRPAQGAELKKMVFSSAIIMLGWDMVMLFAFEGRALLFNGDATSSGLTLSGAVIVLLALLVGVLFLAVLNWLAMGPFTRWSVKWRDRRAGGRVPNHIKGQAHELLTGGNRFAIPFMGLGLLTLLYPMHEAGSIQEYFQLLSERENLGRIITAVLFFSMGVLGLLPAFHHLKLYEDGFSMRWGLRDIWWNFRECDAFHVTSLRFFGLPMGDYINFNLVDPARQSAFGRGTMGYDAGLMATFGLSAEALCEKMNASRRMAIGTLTSARATEYRAASPTPALSPVPSTSQATSQLRSKTGAVAGVVLMYISYVAILWALFSLLFLVPASTPSLLQLIKTYPIWGAVGIMFSYQALSALPAVMAGGLYLRNVAGKLEGWPLAALVLAAVFLDLYITIAFLNDLGAPRLTLSNLIISILCAKILIFWFYLGPLNHWLAKRNFAFA